MIPATIRRKVNDALADRRLHIRKRGEALESRPTAELALNETRAAREVARQAAIVVQDALATNLSGIVTKAIQTVFGDNTEFVAEFVERRGVSECDLYVKVNGEKRSILRGDGGGLADVCGTCLQIAFIMLSDVDRYFIADEPARHLDGEAQERFAQVLTHLCKEFNFTMIFATHSTPITETANKVFRLSKPGDETIVEVLR